MWPEVKEGLNWIVRSPYLRRIAACTGTSNFFGTMGFAIFVLYALRILHLQPWEIGLVFAAGSVGAIIGALVVNRIQKRIGVGPAIIAMAVLFSIAGIAVPLAPKSFPLPLLCSGASSSRSSAASPTTSRRSACARRSRPSACRAA